MFANEKPTDQRPVGPVDGWSVACRCRDIAVDHEDTFLQRVAHAVGLKQSVLLFEPPGVGPEYSQGPSQLREPFEQLGMVVDFQPSQPFKPLQRNITKRNAEDLITVLAWSHEPLKAHGYVSTDFARVAIRKTRV